MTAQLRGPITKPEEETDTHDSDTELAELQLNTQQTHGWVPGGRLLAGTDRMLEHENCKTMSSHAHLVSVSRASTVVIFVDIVVLPLEMTSGAREASEVPKMTGTWVDAASLIRSVQFTDREREIEAKIDARKVLVEDAVALTTSLRVKRDPSVKDRHQSEQELPFGWFAPQKIRNEEATVIDASVPPWSDEWGFNMFRSLEGQEVAVDARQSVS